MERTIKSNGLIFTKLPDIGTQDAYWEWGYTVQSVHGRYIIGTIRWHEHYKTFCLFSNNEPSEVPALDSLTMRSVSEFLDFLSEEAMLLRRYRMSGNVLLGREFECATKG